MHIVFKTMIFNKYILIFFTSIIVSSWLIGCKTPFFKADTITGDPKPVHSSPTKRALLIGISKYSERVGPLEGPANDITSLHEILPSWGFAPENITVLRENQATREGILGALQRLAARTRSGDYVLVYFSGHGTSAEDRDFGQRLDLPYTSGALVPADLNFSPNSSPEALTQTLIVGNTDIRPIFEQMDRKGAYVLAIFDACYSGNTVRSIKSTLKQRRLDLRGLMRIPGNSSRHELYESVQNYTPQPYPYRNISYLGAASENQPALDLGSNETYMTVDNKPHGAFTDTLLRILKGQIGADTNGDGALSPAELHAVLRPLVTQKYGHTPQLLPRLGTVNTAQQRNFFIKASKTVKQPSASKGFLTRFRVWVDNTFSNAQRRGLGRISGIKVKGSTKQVDLQIRRKEDNIVLILPNNHHLISYKNPSDKELQQALSQQKIAQALRRLHHPNTHVQLQLERTGTDSDGTAIEGNLIGFRMRANQPVYYLILDVDPAGRISVLYPANNEELKQVPANRIVDLGGQIKVRPPFGTDYVKVFAFTQLPYVDALRPWIKQEHIPPNDSRFAKLACLVGLKLGQQNCSADNIAVATFTITTYPAAQINQ